MKFYDEQSGATLHMDRFYGFGDAGGIAGSFDGYDNMLGALVAIRAIHEGADVDISSDPKDLGVSNVCVLSGQQYVDQLKQFGSLEDYGHFVE